MAKKKTVEAEVLIKLLDEYRLENPNVKVTIPQFGVYIRNKGYNVQDYTIRRSTEFRVYLKKINNSTAEDIRSDLVTYKTLDVDDFIKRITPKEILETRLLTEIDIMQELRLMPLKLSMLERRWSAKCLSWKATLLSLRVNWQMCRQKQIMQKYVTRML